MDIFGSFAIAFSMYSRIPMPYVSWTKKRMAYALCFFPLVGAAAGILLYGAVWLLYKLEFQRAVPFAAAALPLIVTGGIHMDGYLDVIDARSSHSEKDKKLEILKDPHTGAFAIIGFGCYLLLYLGAFFCLDMKQIPAVCAGFVLSRSFSGFSVVAFPKAKNTGLASTFSSQAEGRTVMVVMAVYVMMTLSWLICFYTFSHGVRPPEGYGLSGCPAGYGFFVTAMILIACLGSFYYYYVVSIKEFGGITGDLAGYFLQICELAILFAVVAAPKIWGIFL